MNKKMHRKNNKFQLIRKTAAWAGILALVILYAVTFVLAVSGKASEDLLMGCIVASVLVSVLIYAVILAARVLENRNPADVSANQNPSSAEDGRDVGNQNPTEK